MAGYGMSFFGQSVGLSGGYYGLANLPDNDLRSTSTIFGSFGLGVTMTDVVLSNAHYAVGLSSPYEAFSGKLGPVGIGISAASDAVGIYYGLTHSDALYGNGAPGVQQFYSSTFSQGAGLVGAAIGALTDEGAILGYGAGYFFGQIMTNTFPESYIEPYLPLTSFLQKNIFSTESVLESPLGSLDLQTGSRFIPNIGGMAFEAPIYYLANPFSASLYAKVVNNIGSESDYRNSLPDGLRFDDYNPANSYYSFGSRFDPAMSSLEYYTNQPQDNYLGSAGNNLFDYYQNQRGSVGPTSSFGDPTNAATGNYQQSDTVINPLGNSALDYNQSNSGLPYSPNPAQPFTLGINETGDRGANTAADGVALHGGGQSVTLDEISVAGNGGPSTPVIETAPTAGLQGLDTNGAYLSDSTYEYFQNPSQWAETPAYGGYDTMGVVRGARLAISARYAPTSCASGETSDVLRELRDDRSLRGKAARPMIPRPPRRGPTANTAAIRTISVVTRIKSSTLA